MIIIFTFFKLLIPSSIISLLLLLQEMLADFKLMYGNYMSKDEGKEAEKTDGAEDSES